jgi:hypothetical protein
VWCDELPRQGNGVVAAGAAVDADEDILKYGSVQVSR